MIRLEVSELRVYPVKSLGGVALDESDVQRRGLRWDRHWMVVDASGRFLTQRQLPRMALVATRVDGDGLLLNAPGMPALRLPLDASGEPVTVTVWRDTLVARAASVEADRWLSDFLGMACRLVRFPAASSRPVDPAYARPGDETAFSDGFPLLLAGDGSLAELNRHLARPLAMSRFRPNLVVAGAEPFAEDGWRRIRVGGVALRVAKPCSRCLITTVDPARGEVDGDEPLRALAAFRQRGNKVYFGQNLIPDSEGVIRVGDRVEVLEAG
ncbi:MAG: MOSC N-terminal beta barrel domain-containing protein [Gammaproteobacteria bacterium]|jgi:uncharacterized protein YcbX|nr:MOSC N-terminal beta barrel domain-containing protein [Gammaproteobacteria bacterium]